VAGIVVLACAVSAGLVVYVTVHAGQATPSLSSTPLAVTTAETDLKGEEAAPYPGATPPQPAVTTTRTADLPAVPGKRDDLLFGTEALLRAIEVPARDRLDLARRFNLSDQPIPAVVNAVTPFYLVGDQETFCVLESDALRHFHVSATLRYKGDHSYWWVQNGRTVSESGLIDSAEAFETGIYPTNRDFFGSEWTPGVDNDPRIHIFMGTVPGVSGYFYSVNQYSRLINPCSNEKEMFYINLDAVRPGTPALEATLAHEFQHMIHWYHDANEETWVNEGLSDLAMELNGHAADDRSYSFARAPDTQLTAWAELPQDTFPHYGASYLFLSYFLARFGHDLTRQVVAGSDNGTAGFDTALAEAGLPQRFDDIFADWVVANYLDKPEVGSGQWGYAHLDIHPIQPAAKYDSYPVDDAGDVRQYATDYIVFNGRGDLTVTFRGPTTVKIAPNAAYSGAYQWWSNRGDDSNMTLTRKFDLSAVSEATLRFMVWYDIEQGWDFAFVAVSTDSGDTWQILPGRYTTSDNPSGNSFGHAWSGTSGGAETPEWVQEEVDLTPYAGKTILVRFEYVTDDAVSHVGLMLDDIAIPQIGYFDDVEAGSAGWTAHGFARIDNVLPQRYLVQAILVGDTPQVQRMLLDGANHGQLTIYGLGSEVDHVVLAVSGITPFTTQPTEYRLRATLSGPGEAIH
jgi:hypothetical protein